MSRLLIIFSPSPPDMDCRTSSGLEGSWGQKYHQESTESTVYMALQAVKIRASLGFADRVIVTFPNWVFIP